MLKAFHVSFVLILGLKDEPYDEGIIVHVFLLGYHQPGRMCLLRSRPALLRRRSASLNAPHSLIIFLTVIIL
jgi:hypothetical protein